MKRITGAGFPQNYIISHPLQGGLLIFAFSLIFTLLYKPLGSHASQYLGYEITMTIYALISGIAIFGLINLLVKIKTFSPSDQWSLTKELSAIFILLLGMGLIIFFSAFIIEEPADRWNLPTLVNSVSNAFLIGILPFIFFTAVNYLILISPETTFKPTAVPAVNQPAEEMLQIKSQLKKESLYIFPDQVMYVESESNYVKFYLLHENKIQKKVIRSSMSRMQ